MRLTAATDAIADADGLGDPRFECQWIRVRSENEEREVDGATGKTYTVVPHDTGKRMKVRVSFTDDGGTVEAMRSAPTGEVAAAVAEPALRIADAEATEGNDGTVELAVTLDATSSETVTVDYQTREGSAGENDYTATTGTLTFPAGTNTQSVSVAITDDESPEGQEEFVVGLTNAAGARIEDGDGTVTIADDDEEETAQHR